ncbi:MAG: MBL fold metallo-hydrolase, partial [Candidatus Aminicenantes bacterium]|nr:MBL fold metallo-hydrolase [Candidatus Aminicenantes bacterium]
MKSALGKKVLIFVIMSLPITCLLPARNSPGKEEIEVTRLAPNLYKLCYDNINLVASVGKDGVLLSDTGFEHMANEIRSEVIKLGRDDVKIVINTHWHSDHTDGNKAFGKEATIIAHHNVRKLLSERQVSKYWNEEHAALPECARPCLTFEEILTVHFNDEEIELIHFPNSHSDGDVIVFFKKSGVVHLGDLLFSDGFPAIDFENGGNPEMWAKNLHKIIAMMPEGAKFIAGHGRDYSLDDLKKYQQMMSSTVRTVRDAMDSGESL